MIFDQLAGLVERHSELAHLRKFVEPAYLFVLPGIPHEFLPKKVERYEFYEEHFFLPYQDVAIEDKAGLVILSDIQKDARGLRTTRHFIEAIAVINKVGFTDADHPNLDLIREQFPKDAIMVTTGLMENMFYKNEEQVLAEGQVEGSGVFTPRKVLIPTRPIQSARLRGQVLGNILCAFDEIMYFNSPDRFIVEQSRANPKRRGSTKKILRSHERPTYVLLHPKEIFQKLNMNGSMSVERCPHPRRRHFRTLRSDRYVNRKGEVMVIKETWVGPSEVTIKNIRYRVVLDR